jgi:hypothetical protein
LQNEDNSNKEKKMGLVLQKTASFKLDPDTYVALVVDVKQVEHEQYGPQLHVVFLLKNPTLEGKPLPGDTKMTSFMTPKITPKSKLNSLLVAVGLDLEEGDSVDLDNIKNKKVKLIVQDVKTKDGMITSRITGFMKIVKQTVKTEEVNDAHPPQNKVKVTSEVPVEDLEEKEDAPPPPKKEGGKKNSFSFDD